MIDAFCRAGLTIAAAFIAFFPAWIAFVGIINTLGVENHIAAQDGFMVVYWVGFAVAAVWQFVRGLSEDDDYCDGACCCG